MKCKWHKCDNEAKGKSPFCGGTCKKRYQRASGTQPGQMSHFVPVEVGQEPSGTQVGQTVITKAESHVGASQIETLQAIHEKIPKPEQSASSTQDATQQEPAQPTKSDEAIAEYTCLDGLEDIDDHYVEQPHREVIWESEPGAAKAIENILTGTLSDPGSYQHYLNNPNMYVHRREPEKMNWGKRMSITQLVQAGLKCNRQPIPGDWDYEGCVTAEMIAESKRKPAQAAPVDEVEVEA